MSHQAPPPQTNDQPAETRSLGEIVSDITTDMSTLIHQEVDLAKTELKQEVTKAGKGAGMLGGAGLAGWFTLLFLSLALTWLLDNWMPVELAALIVAVLWGIAAAGFSLRGKKGDPKTEPPPSPPQQTPKKGGPKGKKPKDWPP